MSLTGWENVPLHLVARCVLVLACLSEVPQSRDVIATDTEMSVEEVSDVIRTLKMYHWNVLGNALDGWSLFLTRAQRRWVTDNYVESV